MRRFVHALMYTSSTSINLPDTRSSANRTPHSRWPAAAGVAGGGTGRAGAAGEGDGRAAGGGAGAGAGTGGGRGTGARRVCVPAHHTNQQTNKQGGGRRKKEGGENLMEGIRRRTVRGHNAGHLAVCLLLHDLIRLCAHIRFQQLYGHHRPSQCSLSAWHHAGHAARRPLPLPLPVHINQQAWCEAPHQCARVSSTRHEERAGQRSCENGARSQLAPLAFAAHTHTHTRTLFSHLLFQQQPVLCGHVPAPSAGPSGRGDDINVAAGCVRPVSVRVRAKRGFVATTVRRALTG